MQVGDNVLIWGASGGLDVFAVQLAKLAGANPIAVVSQEDNAELVRELGAEMIIDRREFDLSKGAAESRRFGKKIRELTGGEDADIVFEPHYSIQSFSMLLACPALREIEKLSFRSMPGFCSTILCLPRRTSMVCGVWP